jgi:hypothetical protein
MNEHILVTELETALWPGYTRHKQHLRNTGVIALLLFRKFVSRSTAAPLLGRDTQPEGRRDNDSGESSKDSSKEALRHEDVWGDV